MLPTLLAIVGVSAVGQLSADVDYRVDPGGTLEFSGDVNTGVEGDLEFVFEDEGGLSDDGSRLNSGSTDLESAPPTRGGEPEGAAGTTVGAPLPASGGLGTLGLALLALRRRR